MEDNIRKIFEQLRNNEISIDQAEIEISKMFSHLPLLRLAGKVALNARMVINSNTKDLSIHIKKLEESLDIYDNKVYNNEIH